MKVAHYSRKCLEIINSKRLFMTKLKDCKGQEDFCLTLDMFTEILEGIDLDKIEYNNYLSREKFEKIIKYRSIAGELTNLDNGIYGFCLTTNPPTKEFISKYGNEYIEFDLDDIMKINTGFLFSYKVFYEINNIESYLYGLCSKIYYNGEYKIARALELPNTDFIFKLEDIFTRLFYYSKILYKRSSMSFENEIRVFLDESKINSGVAEQFTGKGYDYGQLINNRDLVKYIEMPNKERNHYSLKLDYFNIEKKAYIDAYLI